MRTNNFDSKNAPPRGTLRRAVRAMFCLVIITACLAGAASAADIWDGTVNTAWYDDSSKEAFTLTTAEDLAGLAKLVNDGTTFDGKTVTLAADIDLNNLEWTPIGNSSSNSEPRFQGTFDGGYHTISGLNITETDSNVGLFGTVYNGQIKNLHVDGNINVINPSCDSILHAGGVAGYFFGLGSIVNTTSSVDITISYEENAVVAGGIAGYFSGRNFVNCSSSGDIQVTSGRAGVNVYIGGIIGHFYGNSYSPIVERCYSTGDITVNANGGYTVGGIVGYTSVARVTISQCYSTCNITTNAENYDRDGYIGVGGILGQANWGTNISDCFTTGNLRNTVTGKYFSAVSLGGILGLDSSSASHIMNCYAVGNVINEGYDTADENSKKMEVNAAGISGRIYATDATVSGSYALNQKITTLGNATVNNSARVVGDYIGGSLSNYGWVGTKVNDTTVTSDDVSSVHGKDVGLAWNTLFPEWDTSIWQLGTAENYKLPILAGLPAPSADAIHLKVETVTVTFHKVDGIGATSDVTVTSGSTVSAPAVSYVGYTLEGWYTEDTHTNKYEFETEVTTDLNLYANWTHNTYTVKFHNNTGTGSMENQPFVYDVSQNLCANTFVKTGHQFAGWAETPDGAVKYTDTVSVQNLSAVNNSEVTLYANWTANTTTVIFNANGGGDSGTMENQVFKYGIAQNLLPNNFTNTSGYKFVQWNTTEGKTYSDGAEFTSNLVENSAEIILYAEWARYYNVTFETNGGSTVPLQEVKNGTLVTAPGTPTKSSSTFSGWYKDNGFSSPWNFGTDVVTADITLYAKWTSSGNTGGGTGGGGSSGGSTTPSVTPSEPTEPEVTPTEPTEPDVPAEPVVIPPSETVVEETQEIVPANIITPTNGVPLALVELVDTNALQTVAVPANVVEEKPGASVQVVEGNAEEVILVESVKAEDVHLIVEVSVVDTEGNKVTVDEPGHFILAADVPDGKKLVVGHYKNDVWVDCTVEDLGNGQYKVHYNGLSPFAAVFIEEHEESPFAAEEEPTAPASPAPLLGLLAGLACAAVLRRK